MNEHSVTYAPARAQAAFQCSLSDFAARDARYRHPPRDPLALAWLVQDSADQLELHLTLRLVSGERFEGHPGRYDEAQGEPCLAPLCLAELQGALCCTPLPDGAPGAELLTWPRGIVASLRQTSAGGEWRVARRLNLANFIDRLELEFLLTEPPCRDRRLLGWRLGANGAPQARAVTLGG